MLKIHSALIRENWHVLVHILTSNFLREKSLKTWNKTTLKHIHNVTYIVNNLNTIICTWIDFDESNPIHGASKWCSAFLLVFVKSSQGVIIILLITFNAFRKSTFIHNNISRLNPFIKMKAGRKISHTSAPRTKKKTNKWNGFQSLSK